MDKRLLIAVVVSMGILFLWFKIFPSVPVQAPHAPVATEAQPRHETGTDADTPSAASSGQAPGASAQRKPEALVTLESPDVNYVFSTRGASLRKIKLKDRQFLLQRN